MESCQSGLMCRSRKAMRCKPPAVRIRHSPPIESHTKQPLGFVSYFYLWDCFGIVINFERPKIENSSHLNWIHQKRDAHGNFCK